MNKWNPGSGSYKDFSPGIRRYPQLSHLQKQQLSLFKPSRNGELLHYPARVRTQDGTWFDDVLIAESSAYLSVWGVWPDQDSGKKHVGIDTITEILESPNRLPARWADLLYEAGESGMGYQLFAIRYADSSISYHLSGNLVDFVAFPEGKAAGDIKSVTPHEGRGRTDVRNAPNHSWCLFSE